MWLHNRKGFIGYDSGTGEIEKTTKRWFLTENGYGQEENNFEYISGADADLRRFTQTYITDGFGWTREKVYI